MLGPANASGGTRSPSKNGLIAFDRASDPGGHDGEIYVMHPNGSGQRQLTPHWATRFWYDPAWSPNGTQIAFAGEYEPPGEQYFCAHVSCPDIYVVNVDGSPIRRLT